MSKPAQMLLPPHDRASGEVSGPKYHSDARIPSSLWRHDTNESPIGYRWASRPRVIEHYHRPEQCPDGRHLFDVIESSVDVETGDDGELLDEPFEKYRACLTCVRCGRVVDWAGTRTTNERRTVQPAPIAAGALLAQQVNGFSSFGRDMSTWAIYRDGAQVGLIAWATGPRGKAFFRGRLDEQPEGESVAGETPLAVLRKLSKLPTAVPA